MSGIFGLVEDRRIDPAVRGKSKILKRRERGEDTEIAEKIFAFLGSLNSYRELRAGASEATSGRPALCHASKPPVTFTTLRWLARSRRLQAIMLR